ncbi:MAG: hypothetical protein ACRDTM_09015 [Micromonosporaceae bacterium]
MSDAAICHLELVVPTSPAASYTTVDRNGDPEELLTAPHAARVLGHRDHRSLPAALLDNPDHTTQLPSSRLRHLRCPEPSGQRPHYDWGV